MAGGSTDTYTGLTNTQLNTEIDDTIKVAPLTVTLDTTKTEGRQLRILLKDMVQYVFERTQSLPVTNPNGVKFTTTPSTPTVSVPPADPSISVGSSVVNVSGTDKTVAAQSLPFAFAATGKVRLDAIVVNYLATPAVYELIGGTEVANTATAVRPPIPANRLFVTDVDVTDVVAAPKAPVGGGGNSTEETRAELTSATLDYAVKFQFRDTAGTLNITSITNPIRDAKGIMLRLATGTEITFAAGLNVEILAAQDATQPSYLMLQCIDKTFPAYVASFAVITTTATQPTVNTTPSAPTFASFDDAANTVELVPAAGIPLADYRYTLTGDATIYTVDPSGLITVGDADTTVTAYSIAATGRNQSPNVTQAFTASVPGAITPDAPTNPVTDNTADEFKADIVPGYTDVSDYEIEIV